ncbi:MAG: SulP family inorganic anion transporter [Flavobacteriales bacterium]|nr:SulP family inorganic anion transporter [Flavobacteriales bacterium]
MKFFDFTNIKGDLFGGLTAGVVALPLALAFGEQSGLGAVAGLYGAAFISLFAAIFGGTATQISGPTAPMTALSMLIVGGILTSYNGKIDDALPVILGVFILAGVFQMFFGFIKLGTYIKYIPYTVISGFMTGIGVIIILTMVLPAVGYYSGDDEEVIESFEPKAQELIFKKFLHNEADNNVLVLQDIRETLFQAQFVTLSDIRSEAKILAKNDSKGVTGAIMYYGKAFSMINWIDLALASLSILIIYIFKKFPIGIPGALIALILTTSGVYFFNIDARLISRVPSGFPDFQLGIITEFSFSAMAPFILSALSLALLGSIDSLLTSVVADNLTKTRHNPNRELIGQGIGNIVGGFFGGLPGAGATIRTVVNIKAGGKTRLSGVITGLLLFVMLLGLGPIASMIPAAVLAGILITVGIDVMDYKGLKFFPKMGRSAKIILLVVLLLTVFWQLIYAVAVGLVIASFVFMKRMGDISATESRIENLEDIRESDPLWKDETPIDEELHHTVYFKHLNGPLFFGFVSHFRELVDALPEIKVLVIRMENVPFIDQSGIFALEDAIQELYSQNVLVVLSGAKGQSLEMLKKMEIIPNQIPPMHVFDHFKDCKHWLRATLKNDGGMEVALKHIEERKK